MGLAGSGRSDETIRREAAGWVVLVRDPEAAVDRGAFERWCAADPRHALAYVRAERAWERAELLRRSGAAASRALPGRAPWYDRPGGRAAAAAALLVLALGGGALILGRPGAPSSPAGTQSAEFASRLGQIRRLGLADGSRVTLDADSAIRIDFSGKERRIILTRGRARFDVSPRGEGALVVEAGGAAIAATQAVFDLGFTGNGTAVSLLSGNADIRSRRGPVGSKSLVDFQRITAGQRVELDQAGRVTSRRPVVDRVWPTGMIAFDDTRLGDVLTEANRYGAVRIRLADPALAERRVTGAWRVGNPLGMATGLAAAVGLAAARAPDGTIVVAEPARPEK